MSGGHWNYNQRHVRDLGEVLEEEKDPLFSATGILLQKISDQLDIADRCFSGDSSWDGWDPKPLKDIVGEPRINEVLAERLELIAKQFREM